jgi:hypothetical protein
MRYIITFVSLFAVTALFGRSTAFWHKYESSDRTGFRQRSTAPDAMLDPNHAVFELHFSMRSSYFEDSYPEERVLLVSNMVEMSCNGVIQSFKLDSSAIKELTVMPGKYKFYIAFGFGYEEVISDSVEILPGHRTVVDVDFVSVRHEIILFKPVLYLYPEKDLAVRVDLTPKGQFTFTYPQYENGWNGTAHPDGSMTIAGKTYPYLFWEGTNAGTFAPDYSTGFIVKQKEVVAFLEEKLTAMGLSAQEQTDFITFWGPRMANAPQGHVQFLFNEDYDDVAALSVSPKPDATYRVYLLWTPLSNDMDLRPKAQELPKMSRKGFHVLEWGGSEWPQLSRIPLVSNE